MIKLKSISKPLQLSLQNQEGSLAGSEWVAAFGLRLCRAKSEQFC